MPASETSPEVPHVAVATTPPAAQQEAARVGAPPSPEAVADFADILDALDVHTVPEPTRTGRTNLCGGTGEQVDPLAYDGWSDKPCPGCDACKDVVPETAQPHGLHPFEARRASLIARLYMAGFAKVDGPSEHLWRFDGPNGTVLIPVGHFEDMLDHAERECAKVEQATAPPATVEEFLGDLESGDGEPSVGDVDDALDSYPGGFATSPPAFGPTPAPADEAPLFVGGTDSAPAELVARWGHKHTAPVQPMSADLDGLAAPSPTVAELQQQLVAERARADLCDAEAVSQRQRAEAVEAELFEVDRALHTLGAYGNGPTKERLLQVLTPDDRRAILEFDAAEARMDLARLRARARLNPAPPERVAELVAKVAALDARIAALDAGEVRE